VPFEEAATIRLDPFHQAFYQILAREGILVVDLLPSFLAARDDRNSPLYCKTDTHWSSNGCVVAARAIAQEILRHSWLEPSTARELSYEWRAIETSGDLWIALGRQTPREEMRVRFVGEKSVAGLVPLQPDRSSDIVLLGDSHNLVFHAGDDMQARGAGLPDQLALELSRVVDLVAVRGSGATPARVNLMRRARSDPDYLAGKRLVIWCFAAREFTESSGWQKVPLTR
jgi:alginate O-acetyltransferase complex protein AlgJ